MATRPCGAGSASSLKQSLGPPSRVIVEPEMAPQRKSKVPVMGAVKTPSASRQCDRRHTQVLSATTPRTASLGSSRSRIYGQSTPSKMKDPRPLSDKSYQAASIRRLLGFLSDKNYPNMTPRTLQSPSTKEFLHILNFMLEMIDESLIISGMNIVEEVPKVLKVLGYPFTVSKNHMLNVGSPHSWPILLGALMWLTDACTCLGEDDTTAILFPGEHGSSDEQAAKQKTNAEMYRVFMEEGKDSPHYQELVQQREDAARKELENYQKEVVRLREENARLKEVVEELSKSSIPTLQARIQQNQAEYTELVHKSTELTTKIHELEEACNELEAAASQTEIQIEASKEKSKELEEQICSQPMSVKDAQHILQEIHDAEDVLEKHRQMRVDQERVEELQMQHTKSVTLIDSECRQVNDKLRRLVAALPEASSLAPVDYYTSKSADPEVLQTLVTHARKLKHEIQILHQQVATEISDAEKVLIVNESLQSTLDNEQVKKQREIEKVQHSLDIKKSVLEQRKMKFEEIIKAEQAEKHALEKKLMSLQHKLQGESQGQIELATMKKETEAKISAMAADLHERTTQLQNLRRTATEFIDASKEQQKQAKERLEKLALKFKKITLPPVPEHLK